MTADVKSLLIYFSSFLMSVFIANIYQKKIKYAGRIERFIWHSMIIMFPALVAGFRYNVGTDYFNYVTYFEETSGLLWVEIINANAPLFFGLIKCCTIMIDPQWMFLIFSYLTLIIFMTALEYWKERISIPYTLLIYYICFYSWSLNGVRQGLAITMVFLACTYLVLGHYKFYFLWLFLAVLVHSTAIIALAFWFCVMFLKKNNYNFMICNNKMPIYDFNYLLALFLSPFVINICYVMIDKVVNSVKFFSKYQGYLGDVDMGIGIMLLFLLLFWPIFLLTRDTMSDIVFRHTMEIAATFLLFGYLGYIGYTMYRLRLYSYLVVVIMVAQFCKKQKKIIRKVMYVYYFVLFFVCDYVRQTMMASDIFPYTSIYMR